MNWTGWPIQRILILFVGIVFFSLFIQVTLFHYRQNFRHWSMWVPVIETPFFAIIAVILSLYYMEWLEYTLAISLAIGAVSGLIGSYFHIRGVSERVGGYALRNFLIGPPLTLPGMITAISLLGLIALYWG
jgi:ABC-type sulfate transport system permease component